MKYRKNMFTKIVSLVIAVLFTCQCMTVNENIGALIRTEKIVKESDPVGYEYRFDLVKPVTLQDLTVEYKIVKIPQLRVKKINVYEKTKKLNRLSTAGLGAIVGLLAGALIGITAGGGGAKFADDPAAGLIGAGAGAFLGGITPLLVNGKEKKVGEIKVPEMSREAIPNSTPIPFQNQPVEIKLYNGSDIKSFKTFTDNEGVIKVNLVDDFNLQKLPANASLALDFTYINTETGKTGSYRESIRLLPSSQK